MGTPVKVRIVQPDFVDNSHILAHDLEEYPDTSETGETYDAELQETRPNLTDYRAIGQAKRFLRAQRTRSARALTRAHR